ncbi:hypothetical protein [Conyzicola sp.]|uniref:hypothetical protein n=1 Tax=Conyzicola sp. TaxID=1969404 RepID=UPI00398A3441
MTASERHLRLVGDDFVPDLEVDECWEDQEEVFEQAGVFGPVGEDGHLRVVGREAPKE